MLKHLSNIITIVATTFVLYKFDHLIMSHYNNKPTPIELLGSWAVVIVIMVTSVLILRLFVKSSK